ncbi:MAG: tetratricopeptide repeat protein [Planctomycetes bacterium]|nr:tetratricopeptide repeat protein [Planctomycetota bacterium]
MSMDGYSPEEQRKRKFAADCLKKAQEAMGKQNWDYACEMLGTSVKLVPDNVMFRQTLRGVQRKKYKDNKTGASMAFLKLNGIRSKIKKARSAKNWPDMDTAAEEGLAVNPWDGQFNADLGEAARERGFDEIAVFAYETAVAPDGAPENKDFLIALAGVYEIRRDYRKAVASLEKVMQLDPLNGAVRSKIHALGANEVIDKGNYEDAKNTQDVRTDTIKQGYEESVKGDARSSSDILAPGESQENDLLRAIKKDPANVAGYLKLADFYKREGRLEESARTFKQALDVSGDANVREQMEDVELDMVRKNVQFAKEAYSRNKDDEDARKNAFDLQKELRDQEIEVFSRRVERYPADLKLKHELAMRFMAAAKHALAIPLLQAASKDVRLEAQVLVSLGKCFLAQKQNQLANRQFQKAVEKLNANDQPEPFKECHYLLGRLAEAGKDFPLAEKHYSEVLAVDYAYKDTAARLEEIQKQMGGGGQVDMGDM